MRSGEASHPGPGLFGSDSEEEELGDDGPPPLADGEDSDEEPEDEFAPVSRPAPGAAAAGPSGAAEGFGAGAESEAVDLVIRVDGARPGNGQGAKREMGAGVAVFRLVAGAEVPVLSVSVAILRVGRASNNLAEWSSLCVGFLVALVLASPRRPSDPSLIRSIRFVGDSQVVRDQFNGDSRIGDRHFEPFQEFAQSLRARLCVIPSSGGPPVFRSSALVEWEPRAENSVADAAANWALSSGRSGIQALDGYEANRSWAARPGLVPIGRGRSAEGAAAARFVPPFSLGDSVQPWSALMARDNPQVGSVSAVALRSLLGELRDSGDRPARPRFSGPEVPILPLASVSAGMLGRGQLSSGAGGSVLAALPPPPGGGASSAARRAAAPASARASGASAAAGSRGLGPPLRVPVPPPDAGQEWVDPPFPEIGPMGEGLAALDHVSVDVILANPCSQVREVPKALHAAWAHVMADVLEQVQAVAEGEAEARDRSLKWFLVIHQLLLRSPPRGGRRGQNVIPRRFDLWRAKSYEKLVAEWLLDRSEVIAASRPESVGRPEPEEGSPRLPREVPGAFPPPVGAGETLEPIEEESASPSPDEAARRERVEFGLQAAERQEVHSVRRALDLVGAGELSKAVAGLCTNGLGNLSKPEIVEQMRRKHPRREHAVPSLAALAALGPDASAGDQSVPGMSAFGPRLSVRLQDPMRRLRRLRGTGITGFRNEYLRALSEKFVDTRAASVVPSLQWFAERYLNAEFPPWFYKAMATVEVCAPIKKVPDVGEVPDCRPVGMGEVVIRMINSKLMADSKEAAHEVLWPHNVGSATRDGCGILAHGIRAITEMHPEFAVLKFDVVNAHNSLRRVVALKRMAENELLRHLVPAYWAQYVGKSRIYFHGPSHEVILADFASEEAWRQGCPLAQLGFNQAIHAEVLWLDAELAKHGGGARFNHDDGYAFGPPDVVFELAEEFERRLEPLGLAIAIPKSECFSRGHAGDLRKHPKRPIGTADDGKGNQREKFPLGVAYRDRGGAEQIGIHSDAATRCDILGYGIVVAGVPIGDQEYVRVHLAKTASATKSKIESISLKLRAESVQALHVLNIFCLQPIFTYWTQHVYPSDIVERNRRYPRAESPAAVVDAALLEVACATHGAFVRDDPFANARLRLPAKFNGGGLRSLADNAEAAFAAAVIKIAPKLIESTDDQGTKRRGFLDGVPGMAALFGEGSFDGDADFPWGGPGRFTAFVSEPDGLPCSWQFTSAWNRCREAAVGDPGAADRDDANALPRSGLLAQPVENAGLIDDAGNGIPTRPLVGGMQHALSEQIEKYRRGVLDRDLRELAPSDFRRIAWLNCNATSRVWLVVLPDRDNELTNPEFAEVAARYFGAPSPACSAARGERFGRGHRGGDPRTVDEYGFTVNSVSSVPGGGWACLHDQIKNEMASSCREMGQEVAVEVHNLFSHLIPQGPGRVAWREQSSRTRWGLVPDFAMRIRLGGDAVKFYLLELKCIHLSASWYGPGAGCQREEARGKSCVPVEKRAKSVAAEYVKKAQETDQTFCGTAQGEIGPVEAKLRSFHKTVPLVFGAFGEASDGVEQLIDALAEAGADVHWRGMKAKKREEAKGALVAYLRRRWGMVAVRGNAQLILNRMQFVGEASRADSQMAKIRKCETRALKRERYFALQSFGPSTGDSRPAAATRWA